MERVWSRRESCSLKQQLFKYQKSQHQTPRSLQHISPTPILCTVPTHICSPAVSVCSFQLKPMSQHHHFGRWSWQLPSLAQLLSGNINQFSFLAIHYQKHPQRRSKQQSLTSSWASDESFRLGIPVSHSHHTSRSTGILVLSSGVRALPTGLYYSCGQRGYSGESYGGKVSRVALVL